MFGRAAINTSLAAGYRNVGWNDDGSWIHVAHIGMICVTVDIGARTKSPVPTSAIAGILGGCSTDTRPDPHTWFVTSYDNAIIAVQDDRRIYKATCETSKSFNNATTITDPKNVVEFSTCGTAIGLVGHHVQSLEGKQRDGDGRIVFMWSVGDILALRSWRDESSPWKHEEFRITVDN